MGKSIFRNISAIILLIVFVSMTVFTDFHRHEIVKVNDICEKCVNHTPHPDHISQQVSFSNICVLCHWLTNTFEITEFLIFTACLTILQTVRHLHEQRRRSNFLEKLTNKAPPVF